MISQTDIELLERYIDATLSDGDVDRLRNLLSESSEARVMLRSLATVDFGLQDIASGGVQALARQSDDGQARAWTTTKSLLALAATTILALGAGLYYQSTNIDATSPQQIATISGLEGPVLWTGDGGRVMTDLSIGDSLTGGTIEGTTPGSRLELVFDDGSTVTVSGNSTLTFSDLGQKELHLREGNFTANVSPQDKPMLVHTRTALLEVLGTQFKVDAGLASTSLNVNQGRVRVKRLSDGRTVDVSAKHRLIADVEHEMSIKAIPESVYSWNSQLQLGPDDTLGRWSPKTSNNEAKLRAIPYVHTTPQGEVLTLYNVALTIARGDSPPVFLQPGSQIRVRGRVASAQRVTFGVVVSDRGGEYAGNFSTFRPAAAFESGQDFEVVFDVRDFQLIADLAHMKDQLTATPADLIVETFWCNSRSAEADLEIVEVDVLSSTSSRE